MKKGSKIDINEIASLIIIFVFGYSVMMFLLNYLLKPMIARRVEGMLLNPERPWKPKDYMTTLSDNNKDFDQQDLVWLTPISNFNNGGGICNMTWKDKSTGKYVGGKDANKKAPYEIEYKVFNDNMYCPSASVKECCINHDLEQINCKKFNTDDYESTVNYYQGVNYTCTGRN